MLDKFLAVVVKTAFYVSGGTFIGAKLLKSSFNLVLSSDFESKHFGWHCQNSIKHVQMNILAENFLKKYEFIVCFELERKVFNYCCQNCTQRFQKIILEKELLEKVVRIPCKSSFECRRDFDLLREHFFSCLTSENSSTFQSQH